MHRTYYDDRSTYVINYDGVGYYVLQVVLAATGLAFHGQLSAMGVMKARSKIFKSDDFKNRHATKKLLEEHKQATGEDSLPEGGYPDMGNGRYSEAMTYKEWYDLNNNQRVHQNFLEHLPAVQTYLVRLAR